MNSLHHSVKKDYRHDEHKTAKMLSAIELGLEEGQILSLQVYLSSTSKMLRRGLLKLPYRIQVIFIAVILNNAILLAILDQLCQKKIYQKY